MKNDWQVELVAATGTNSKCFSDVFANVWSTATADKQGIFNLTAVYISKTYGMCQKTVLNALHHLEKHGLILRDDACKQREYETSLQRNIRNRAYKINFEKIFTLVSDTVKEEIMARLPHHLQPVTNPDRASGANADKQEIRKAYGKNKNVFLTDTEHAQLIEKYGQALTAERIAKLSAWLKKRNGNIKAYYKEHSFEKIAEYIEKDYTEDQIRTMKTATTTSTITPAKQNLINRVRRGASTCDYEGQEILDLEAILDEREKLEKEYEERTGMPSYTAGRLAYEQEQLELKND